jgi:hypothetical protein
MKTFYRITILAFVVGLALLCCFAPWTASPAAYSGPNGALSYAPLWSHQAMPGAKLDTAAFVLLTGVVGFFAIVIGGAAYFFRDNRGTERADV